MSVISYSKKILGKIFECDFLRQSHPRLVLRFRMAPYLTF